MRWHRVSPGRVRDVQHLSLPITPHRPRATKRGPRVTTLRVRLVTLGLGVAMAATVAGCGSVASAPDEPAAKAVQLEVSPARFSTQHQVTGDEVELRLTVRNTGDNPAPNLIVSLFGLEDRTEVQPGDPNRLRTTPDDLPDSITRAGWFIDSGTGRTPLAQGDNWTGGTLAPGRTKTMRWLLNAQTVGKHSIRYKVSSGLTNNEAHATSGTGLAGSISAEISDRPAVQGETDGDT
jgi:hypothetical protein